MFYVDSGVRMMATITEQLKDSVSELQTQLQCSNTLLQWLVGRLGGSSEMAALPKDVVLPCTSVDNVHHLDQRLSNHHLDQQLSNVDIRKIVVSKFLFMLKPPHSLFIMTGMGL